MSLQQITTYDTPGNFAFDANIVEVSTLDGNARLIRNWQGAEFFATMRGITAEVSSGSTLGAIEGSVPLTNSEAQFRGVSQETRIEWERSTVDTDAGTLRMLIRPNYDGFPAADQRFGYLRGADGTPSRNEVSVRHLSDGRLTATMRSNSGAVIGGAIANGVSLNSSQVYEIEVSFDLTIDTLNLYLDGLRVAQNTGVSGNRNPASTIAVGSLDASSAEGNQQFDCLALASWSTMLTSAFSYVAIGLTLYPFQLGSDGLIIANHITPNASFQTDALLSLAETVDLPGASDQVLWIVIVGGLLRWYDGNAWVSSDSTFLQANTLQEINDNVATLDLSAGAFVQMRAVLQAGDGDTTPTISQHIATYDFFAVQPDLATCIVFGFVTDAEENPIANVPVVVHNDAYLHGEHVVDRRSFRSQTDATGLFEVELVETATINAFPYTFIIGTSVFRGRGVPSQATESFDQLPTS